MDQDFRYLSELINDLKKAIYCLVDEYNKCIHDIKEEVDLHERFPPLSAEELEEKVIKICEEKCNFYISQFYEVDNFLQLILNNEDVSKYNDNEHMIFFGKLWLGDIFDSKGLRNIKALEKYIETLSEEKEKIQERSFNEIFYNHF
jgi:hypothetical protein